MMSLSVMITDAQVGTLSHASEHTGLSIAELVQRAIDSYLANLTAIISGNNKLLPSAKLGEERMAEIWALAEQSAQEMKNQDWVSEEEFEAGLKARGIV
ncbi:MAG: hypothetical protein AAF639_13725 [Chloroflexota bacterium]